MANNKVVFTSKITLDFFPHQTDKFNIIIKSLESEGWEVVSHHNFYDAKFDAKAYNPKRAGQVKLERKFY
jgi:hypothetical protein